jgi:hypothetical protein
MTGTLFVGAAEGCERDRSDTLRFAAFGSSYEVHQPLDESYK